METVNETLKDLGAIDKEIITVFNKIDAYKPFSRDEEADEEQEPVSLNDFENSWMAKSSAPALFISALRKENIETFRSLLYEKVKAIHTQRYPYDKLLY
jgi:GTP-binding protein HflX